MVRNRDLIAVIGGLLFTAPAFYEYSNLGLAVTAVIYIAAAVLIYNTCDYKVPGIIYRVCSVIIWWMFLGFVIGPLVFTKLFDSASTVIAVSGIAATAIVLLFELPDLPIGGRVPKHRRRHARKPAAKAAHADAGATVPASGSREYPDAAGCRYNDVISFRSDAMYKYGVAMDVANGCGVDLAPLMAADNALEEAYCAIDKNERHPDEYRAFISALGRFDMAWKEFEAKAVKLASGNEEPSPEGYRFFKGCGDAKSVENRYRALDTISEYEYDDYMPLFKGANYSIKAVDDERELVLRDLRKGGSSGGGGL